MNSDQPDHPSSLNRILNSSCALVMSIQGPKAFSHKTANTTEIDGVWRMCNDVVFVVLRLTCYSYYVIS